MAQTTGIEWTQQVWNPVTGCSKVSHGCKNCYAEAIANRFWKDRKFTDVQCHEDRLQQPLRRRKPTTYFVNSMSDLFHEDVPDAFIQAVFSIMAKCPQHTFQVLTKRPKRMRNFLGYWDELGLTLREGFGVSLPNVWLGVSVENQSTADERIPLLLETPAAVRWLSCEPLLGEVDLRRGLCGCRTCIHGGTGISAMGFPSSLDWIVAGGESGPGKRPHEIEWFRSLRDQCATAGVPFFMKQIDKVQPIPPDLMIRQMPQEARA